MSRNAFRAAALAIVLAFAPHSAVATFHLVKIVEVFPGSADQPDAQYVMLQMYASGKNFVSGHGVRVFDASGASVGTFNFTSGVAVGANQATMLIGTAAVASLFGVTPDLSMSPVIPLAGGAVCYESLDCVSWGDFAGTTASPSGTPFNAAGGLRLAMAMRRNLAKDGNPNTLSASDDTNDSAGDFLFATPAPRNNAGQTPPPAPTATPTATPMVTPQECVGDCDSNGAVSSDELLSMVAIALGFTSPPCPLGDGNHDGRISVNEILAAVNGAGSNCVELQPTPPLTGLAVTGVVRLPNGQVSGITTFQWLAHLVGPPALAFSAASVRAVGRGVAVHLSGPFLGSATVTDDQGRYMLRLPEGTTEDTCLGDHFMVAAGATRAFVDSTSAPVDIDFASDAAVSLILGKATQGINPCIYSATDIQRIVAAVRAAPGILAADTEDALNAAALAAATDDPEVQAALAAPLAP